MPPIPLYTAAQTRELDRIAIEEHGTAGLTLMERAGAITFEVIRAKFPHAVSVGVVCGAGNNAGDGYVIARLAIAAGLATTVWWLVDPNRLSGDAQSAYRAFTGAGGRSQAFDGSLSGRDVLVDALLGTGLKRDVTGLFADAVEAMNQSAMPVVAVDIPSGLSADTGSICGTAVRADVTVTFIGRNRGLLTGAGPELTGDLIFDDLGVDATVGESISDSVQGLDERWLTETLPRRSRTAHKGSFGRVVVIGGDRGMPGAIRLAGEAALRAGAGLVRVATRMEHTVPIAMAYPALMSAACESPAALKSQLDWADVGVIGPGLGRSEYAIMVMAGAGEWERPHVLDADGLHWLSENRNVNQARILTPHPGEAARLLGQSVAAIETDRFAAAQAIAQTYGGVCVLKGAGTIVTDGSDIRLCMLGNPGMATAGSGDVLSGVIVAMLAMGMPLIEAASVGVTVHALAGDRCAKAGERGMTAVDLSGHLRGAVNP